jgi:PAS domain S-box-containing protein
MVTDTVNLDWLSRAFDAMPCAAAIVGAGGPSFPLLHVNRAFERLTGYSAEEATGQDFGFLSAAGPGQAALGPLRDALAAGGEGRAELRCSHKGGTAYWSQVSVAPLRGGPGRPARHVVIYDDATAHRQALDGLAAERDRLLSFIEHVPLGMLALDWVISGVFIVDAASRDMPIIYVNAAFERLTGYQGEDALGRNCCFFFDEEGDPAPLAKVRQALSERRETKVELRSRRKDGSRFWNELTLSPVFDEASRLTHYLGIQTDITRRKETEGRLQELSHELRKNRDDLISILNEFPAGTLVVEAEGMLAFASTTCRAILGIAPESVTGQHWRRVLPVDADAARQIQRTFEAPANAREPVTLRWQDAGLATHWVECSVKDDPRDPARRLVFLEDVTELRRLRDKLEATRFGGLIGESGAMAELNRLTAEIARGDWTVLIEGETGVGKELVARGIHEASPRRAGPFIAVNSAGLSESLLASQLFGHRKGAFTGATADQQGFFEAASGGTIFLDEIGDLPFPMQAALLRVLQEHEITRLGETRARGIDVRVVAATHKDLAAECAAGRFREDLLFRLRVARIHIPPLRARKTDIPMLVEHFLKSARRPAGKAVGSPDADAWQCLMAYDWPGNVRELRSCVDFALIHCQGAAIRVGDLPPEIRSARRTVAREAEAVPEFSSDGRLRLLQALEIAGGNRSQAAKLLGISRATLYRRVQELGLGSEI